MKLVLTIALLFLLNSLLAQKDTSIPFIGYFGGYGVYKEMRNDSIGYLCIPNIDTNIIVFISKKLTDYRMYDRKNNLISEGNIGGRKYVDFFKRFGKWTSYFPETGQPKIIGYYYADQPTGLWKYFYPNGQLRQTYSLTLIEMDSITVTRKVGLYEEYYESGQPKIIGFYKISLDTSTMKIYDNLGGEKDSLIRGPVSKPFGIWKYYKVNGELEKEEEY